MPVPLPSDPSIEQLRRQARDLRRAAAAGDPAALAEIAEHAREHAGGPVPLHVAQLVVARRYGFAGWPPLTRHLATVARYRWAPVDEAADVPVDEFLRLACLSYTGADAPARRDRAVALLAADPAIGTATLHAAAATADVDRVRALAPGNADRDGGPYGWPPLMYLAYARHDRSIDPAAVVAAAAILLDHGADPNAGRLWHGLPSPFTVLTGVFGEGEQGPVAQPHHHAEQPLARLLLDRGADPNDSQALYNRMFGTDDSHLVLLLAHGLGRGDGGPWRARLGDTLDPPRRLLGAQLAWAITHDMGARVALLLDHGVSASDPLPDGRAPVAAAARLGNVAMVDLLVAHGAPRPDLDPVDAVVAAALAGDADAAGGADAAVLRRARATRGSALVWAAATGRADAVALLLDLGFDVDALGRGDTLVEAPVESRWHTALHEAAYRGDADLVGLLLDRGADATIRDARFGATAAGWAAHGGHLELAARLERGESDELVDPRGR